MPGICRRSLATRPKPSNGCSAWASTVPVLLPLARRRIPTVAGAALCWYSTQAPWPDAGFSQVSRPRASYSNPVSIPETSRLAEGRPSSASDLRKPVAHVVAVARRHVDPARVRGLDHLVEPPLAVVALRPRHALLRRPGGGDLHSALHDSVTRVARRHVVGSAVRRTELRATKVAISSRYRGMALRCSIQKVSSRRQIRFRPGEMSCLVE